MAIGGVVLRCECRKEGTTAAVLACVEESVDRVEVSGLVDDVKIDVVVAGRGCRVRCGMVVVVSYLSEKGRLSPLLLLMIT